MFPLSWIQYSLTTVATFKQFEDHNEAEAFPDISGSSLGCAEQTGLSHEGPNH